MAAKILAVTGLKQLEAQLGRLSKAAGKAALRRGLAKAAAPLVTRMRGAAPEDEGDLREAIVASPRSTLPRSSDVGKAAFAAAMRAGAGRAQASVALRDALRENGGVPAVQLFVGVSGRPASVAHLYEFGSSRQPARPYARPAWDTDQQDMLDRIRAELKAEIDKSIARATRRGTLRT
jgi:HK97 gp10 family phage protein